MAGVGTGSTEVVASRRAAAAFWVEVVDGRVVERTLPTRYLGG